MRSTNIPAILEVAAGFEQWTATKKAAALREHVRIVQEKMLQDAVKVSEPSKQSSEEATEEQKAPNPPNGPNGTVIPQNIP
jgi:hypothetical protein